MTLQTDTLFAYAYVLLRDVMLGNRLMVLGTGEQS